MERVRALINAHELPNGLVLLTHPEPGNHRRVLSIRLVEDPLGLDRRQEESPRRKHDLPRKPIEQWPDTGVRLFFDLP